MHLQMSKNRPKIMNMIVDEDFVKYPEVSVSKAVEVREDWAN